MSNLSGPEDIYCQLVEQSEENWLLGLVAFAVVEEQRIEWMRHFESQNGSLPTDQQVHDWYRQQPSSVLLRARGTAENALKAYAEEVAVTIEEDYRREIQESALIEEIRSHNRFWPQFGANIAAGMLSTFIFSLLLVLLAQIVFNDPSPVAMIKKSQETVHAK